MMQRDETLLLEAWFRYYGYLFGFENLAVFDNGSTDPGVIETLARYERVGSEIRRGYDRVEDFHAKGAHFRNLIGHWDNAARYDFALPLDADEFLAVFTPDGLSCRRDAIHAHLDALIGTQEALGFDLSLYNAPGRPGCFSVQPYPKSFLSARSIADLDRGFHAARSRLAEGRRQTDLTYLHFHNKPFATLLRQARRKLEGFVDVDDRAVLARHTGPGVHLVRYFFMTEAEYAAQYDGEALLRFPHFARMIAALGADGALFDGADTPGLDARDSIGIVGPGCAPADAVPFSPERYADAHPDIGAAGWNPVHHYVAQGYREGRGLPAASGSRDRGEADDQRGR